MYVVNEVIIVVEKNKGGAPTKYDPKFCDMLIEHRSAGLGYQSFAGVIGVCIQTLNNWSEKHEEFLAAKNRAYPKSLLFWEKKGIAGVNGEIKDFKAAPFIFMMKNMFKEQYGESEATGSTPVINVSISKEEADM